MFLGDMCPENPVCYKLWFVTLILVSSLNWAGALPVDLHCESLFLLSLVHEHLSAVLANSQALVRCLVVFSLLGR